MAKKNLVLNIRQDDDVVDPREEFDHAGTMATWHKRYKFGADDSDYRPTEDPPEWFESLPEGTISLALYLHDHGGLAMNTGGFNDPWDSGQVGWIYIEPDTIRAEYQLAPDAPITDEIRDKARALLKSEVDVYSTYLQGDVWYFELEEGTACACCSHVEWETVESCGGIYNGDDILDHLKSLLPDEAHGLIEEAWQDRGR
jgi:hypothetical protein